MTYFPHQEISEIIEKHQAPLKGFIRARIPSQEDAEDMLQDIWLQLTKTSRRTDLKHIRGWLYQVARNKIIDHYRKKSTEWLEDYLYEEHDGPPDAYESLMATDETPELVYLQDQFWEEFYEALDALPEKQREVFMLNEWEGITLREISEKTGENLKTVISRKRYAVAKMRDHLQDLFDAFFED